jgi:hypothetical protein
MLHFLTVQVACLVIAVSSAEPARHLLAAGDVKSPGAVKTVSTGSMGADRFFDRLVAKVPKRHLMGAGDVKAPGAVKGPNTGSMGADRFFDRVVAKVPKRHLLGTGQTAQPVPAAAVKAGSMNENRSVYHRGRMHCSMHAKPAYLQHPARVQGWTERYRDAASACVPCIIPRV